MAKGTVNKVILIGRLGRDPEMRYTASGTAVVNFSLATNQIMKNQDGTNAEQTEWHAVVAFGRTAEIAGEYLSKGRLVYVEGRLQTRSWEDQNGQKRYKTEVVCSSMQLLGGRSEGNGSSDDTSTADEESGSDEELKETESTKSADKEDDLPF